MLQTVLNRGFSSIAGNGRQHVRHSDHQVDR